MKTENGSIINQYKITLSIGKGGMGEVFLAQDTKLKRQVALKILPPEFAEDKDRMSRFVREAQSASALNHPNIITIYEIGESAGTHFIATEFIDGKTLNDYKQANPLNYKSALEIAIQIASALDEAHLAGIVHRDIKPDNVMVRANGLVKILDFGIAKLAASSTSASDSSEDATAIKSPTMPGMIIGTANYMSPEQAKGKVVDARTDIFSFGVVLYEMIAGQLPFEGENALEMIGAILHKEAKPLNSEVPTEISKIINKCLRKDRDERYQTIKDVGNDLKDVKQELEFKNLMERSIVPNQVANKTEILKATTIDEIHQTTTNQTVASNRKTKYLAVGLLTLLLAVGGFLGYKYLSPTTKQINSIAVMPFENRNSDADTDYLSDGLAESLIFRLTQIPDLKVSPTSSVMRYKGKETDIAKIANELGVDAVMTGRLTKRGDNLNITVELVDARTNKALWGEQYERKLSELLTTQREIVTEIVSKLQIKLSGEGEQKLAKKYTSSDEAYQLYLKGRYYWNKRTEEDLNKAIEQFKAAVDKDPNFALAYTGLSDCYGVLPFYSTVISSDFLPRAKAYATQAIAIDGSLGEAHISLAIADLGLWNWAEAEKGFRRGLELSPNYAIGHQWYGEYLEMQGRYDAALTENKRAQDLDPLSLTINTDAAMIHLAKGDADSAIEACKRTIDLDPNWYAPHRWLALSYMQKGRNSEALAEAEKSVDLSNRHSSTLGILGYVLAQTGKRSEALKIAEELKIAFSKRQAKGTDVGWTYLGLNEKEEVFAWLEKDFESRNPTMPFRLRIPPLNSMSEDSRYKDLWKRMNLPE